MSVFSYHINVTVSPYPSATCLFLQLACSSVVTLTNVALGPSLRLTYRTRVRDGATTRPPLNEHLVAYQTLLLQTKLQYTFLYTLLGHVYSSF